jgi:short subunit dehydrogenase-like uncharacterized protein
MTGARELDVVLYGATGFVGKLTAEYLASRAGDDARVGLGGRSEEKLERLRAGLGERAADWPLILADSQDEAALAAMADRTTAIATTVGPYRKYGMPLVAACARAGTHYADLTGEPLFMREAIDRFHGAAEETGARIVHTCGFDSVPSDIGVHLLHEAAGELEETTLVVRRVKAGISGGTLDTMRGTVDEVRGDPSLLKVIGDPYALSPDRAAEPDLGRERDLRGVEHSRDLETWFGPFVMAPVNTRVVRRSNALQDWAYGRHFTYREVMAFGDGVAGRLRALAVAGGTAGLAAGLAMPPTRFVLDRVLPSPGEGPKEEVVREGFYEIEIHARTPAGKRWCCRETAQGDPGYGATSVIFGESALCLALDGDRLPDRAGVLTPATAMGTVLADRLRAAGQTFDVSRTLA